MTITTPGSIVDESRSNRDGRDARSLSFYGKEQERTERKIPNRDGWRRRNKKRRKMIAGMTSGRRGNRSNSTQKCPCRTSCEAYFSFFWFSLLSVFRLIKVSLHYKSNCGTGAAAQPRVRSVNVGMVRGGKWREKKRGKQNER